ncbi:hypothetical protein FB561_4361 [Kribbella amoyensis]|uniref:DUF2264 domain-containing protein n=1 Tax=Kribbella amoyensis TaxID=996641 RepID=A0A561BWU0_9ACTN|nr:DUF2264 domain-containing protein [Kribbella amoyensis]TWD83202.1 hypothetical protein FB561_4361 [Kribbella amoyensis]
MSLSDRLRATEDRTLSPITGWTRDTWGLLADDLLLAARRHGTPLRAGIAFPGAPGGYGSRVDALEGFARTFLAAGFRVAGEGGADPNGFLDWYAEGLAAGVDPESPERWVRLDEHDQAKVEAASIALVLHLTRPWLWDRLDDRVREQTVDYLAAAVGVPYHPNNWLWFQIVTQTFLASVGGPSSATDIEADLAALEEWAQPDGWYSDGAARSYDHYAGWALQFYPLLWLEMAEGQAAAEKMRATYLRRAEQYLGDGLRLIGADGSPLIQGRSLTYRFAAAAPFWAAARAEVAADPGQLRRAASGITRHFVDAGAPDEDGLLTLGWHGAWRPIAQNYSGPGSPYWASKGLLGLSLPADHPAWTAVEQPLPVEVGEQAVVMESPGWLVSSTPRDGIVRVVNHGTDHASPGDVLRDGPLYARLTYSTATSPILAGEGLESPLDASVVLLDDEGRATSRTGFTRGPIGRLPSGTMYAASHGKAHWVEADHTDNDLGWGRPGPAEPAADLEVWSYVRGDWEVRLIRVGPGNRGAALRVGGTAIPTDDDTLQSLVLDLGGLPIASDVEADNATPLSLRTTVPCRTTDGSPIEGHWYAAALATGRGPLQPSPTLNHTPEGQPQEIHWPDTTTDPLNLTKS